LFPERVEDLVNAVSKATGKEVIPISALRRINIEEFKKMLEGLLPKKMEHPVSTNVGGKLPKVAPKRLAFPENPELRVRKIAEDEYVLEGNLVEYLLKRYKAEYRDSMREILQTLERFGASKQLREHGAKTGDTVYLSENGPMFEYVNEEKE
ncbi:hypothetical protein DRN97_09935, partial [Methanosarcinales archaeon]